MRARGPRPSIARFACSGSRSENITSWPAFTHRPPNVEPILPEPMMPILMGLLCASAAGTAAAIIANRNARRFIRDLLRFRLAQLESIHGLAQKDDPRRGFRVLRE